MKDWFENVSFGCPQKILDLYSIKPDSRVTKGPNCSIVIEPEGIFELTKENISKMRKGKEPIGIDGHEVVRRWLCEVHGRQYVVIVTKTSVDKETEVLGYDADSLRRACKAKLEEEEEDKSKGTEQGEKFNIC